MNRGKGLSEIEGKAVRVAAKERGQRFEFQSRHSSSVSYILQVNFPTAIGPKPIYLRHSLLRQVQRGDVDLVDVAQSVARTVQLLQELFVAKPFFQRLVSEATVAGEENRFPSGETFGEKSHATELILSPRFVGFVHTPSRRKLTYKS
jgi:hypothetical protein